MAQAVAILREILCQWHCFFIRTPNRPTTLQRSTVAGTLHIGSYNSHVSMYLSVQLVDQFLLVRPCQLLSKICYSQSSMPRNSPDNNRDFTVFQIFYL